MPADRFSSYLSLISSRLRLDRPLREDITKELAAHLEDSAHELQIGGLSMSEAQRRAIEALGDPKVVSRKLKWIHGFGRYSKRPFLDACLGSLPFLLALATVWVSAFVPRLGANTAVLVWIAVIGVSVYALKEAVPAWTLTWLGFAHFFVLFIAFVSILSTLRTVPGLRWSLAYTAAFLVTAGALVVFTGMIARKGVEATLLFLLPLSILYASVGYEDAAPSHRHFMTLIAIAFAFLFSFTYILKRNRRPVLFAAVGFLFYNALFADIVRTGASPLNATGPTLIGLWTLIYLVPLLLVSSPAYFYLKRRAS